MGELAEERLKPGHGEIWKPKDEMVLEKVSHDTNKSERSPGQQFLLDLVTRSSR